MQLVKWLVLATAVVATSAYAQARLFAIPAEAKAGTLRHVQGTLVELDGKQAWLAPGAQIRDVFNRLVVPTELMQKRTVRYLTDTSGLVHRVWLLTPEEVAQLPKPKPPAKKDEEASETRVKVGRIQISDGSADFEDRSVYGAPAKIKLTDLELEVEDVAMPLGAEKIPFDVSMKLEGKRVGKHG